MNIVETCSIVFGLDIERERERGDSWILWSCDIFPLDSATIILIQIEEE